MLPIRDNAPSRTVAWLVLAIIALNVLMFCAQLCPVGGPRAWIAGYGLIPTRFVHWAALGGTAHDPARYVPLGTSMFLHDGWLHLGTNMVYLWVFGRALEDRLGRAGLLAVYALAGVAAALGQLLAHPRSGAAMIGASGAVAGLLGAYLVTFPRATVTVAFPFYYVPWVVRVPAPCFLVGWFALQLGQGIADVLSATTEPAVAWWAHVAGFVAGAAGAAAGRTWQPQPATPPARAPDPPRVVRASVPHAALRPSHAPVLVRASRVP